MIAFVCPECKKYLEASEEALGRRVQCGFCEEKFTLEKRFLVPLKDKEIQNGPKSGSKSKFEQKNAAMQKKAAVSQKKNEKSSVLLPCIFLLLAGVISFYLLKPKFPGGSSSREDISQKEKEPQVSITPENNPDSKVSVHESGLKPLQKTFPVILNFEQINLAEWRRKYPNVHGGWMPNKLTKSEGDNSVKNEALDWGHHLGPLGLRVRSHISQWQGREAFAAMVPDCLRTLDGELGVPAIEVVSVVPGSPADGYLEKGDLIVGIEDQPVLSGNNYRPDWKFVFKDRRDIQLQCGELIDKAQSRGDIRLEVLRWPKPVREIYSGKELNKNNKVSFISSLPVTKGQKLKLIIDPLGKNNYDHAVWVNPVLEGPAGKLDLSAAAAVSSRTGWGQILRGKDFKGNKMPSSSITVHGYSELVFEVPEGYNRFSSEVRCVHDRGSFKAKVVVEDNRPPLPVEKKELWVGKGGNSGAGIQNFNIELGDGQLILHSNRFNENIHGDGTAWMNLELSGTYGSMKLIDLPWKTAITSYGRIKKYINGETLELNKKKITDAIYAHADAYITYDLPKGTQKLTGSFSALSYGAVQPKIFHRSEALPLSGEHAKRIKKIRFPIGKTGSFAKGFPKNCAKSELTIKRQADWLAAQQRKDGSWPRWSGYTHSYWDTAHAGLALMSTGDARYDEAIRNAAYFCAFKAPSNWTVPRAMIMVFLCEYYLRTEDKTVLASIQNNYYQLESCIKTDLISGHKVQGFGYGIAGQYIATGHMMLGMAMASKVPINIDKNFVDEIITHAARVSVNGTFPYGRGSRKVRSEKRDYTGGNAMLGPAVLAAYVYGGHESFLQSAKERYRASLGEGDNSHSTSSLAFIWSTAAMSVLDEQLYLDHLDNFKYKLTIDDCWDGGYLKSAFPMDYQGGEGVTGLWIRSAGTIMGLCAARHNLAITGKKDLQPKTYKKGVPATEWDTLVRQYYLRNWATVLELLGSQAPLQLTSKVQKLASIEADDLLLENTRKFILANAPHLISEIAANNKIQDQQKKAYAVELICGLDFQITVHAEGNRQVIELLTLLPFNELKWQDTKEEKQRFYETSTLPLKAEVTVNGQKLVQKSQFKITSLKGFNCDRGQMKLVQKVPFNGSIQESFKGLADISFKIGDVELKYQRQLVFNKPFEGSRVGNPLNFRRFKLPLRMAPRAIYQSLPINISGINFDAMYPAEKMMYPKFRGKRSVGHPRLFHEGDDVIVDFVSSTPICALVLDLDFQSQMKYEKPQSVQIIKGTAEGSFDRILDNNYSTSVRIKPEKNLTILEYDFGKKIILNGLDIVKDRGGLVRIWAYVDERWVPVVWDDYSSNSNFQPEFARIKAAKWRVEMETAKDIKLSETLFYNNPKRRKLPMPVQFEDAKTYPPVLIDKGA